jgi:hypothetical protein
LFEIAAAAAAARPSPEKAPSRCQFFHAHLSKDRLARTSVEMKITTHVQDIGRRSFQFGRAIDHLR